MGVSQVFDSFAIDQNARRSLTSINQGAQQIGDRLTVKEMAASTDASIRSRLITPAVVSDYFGGESDRELFRLQSNQYPGEAPARISAR